MSDHIYTLEQLKALIQPLLIEYHAESAILFGSYARGAATEQSDIDLIVVAGENFRLTSILGFGNELYERSGKNVHVFEISEIQEDSPLRVEIEKDGIRIVRHE